MKRFFSGLFAALVVVLSAAPFLYVFVRSFLSPGGVTFQYYYDVFLASPKYLFRFWKSIGMAVCIAAGQLFISVFAGFGFAKYKFLGRNFLFFLLMILMTLPVQVTLVPDFIMLCYMNLLNTYQGLILTYIGFSLPMAIWLMTNFFSQIEKGFEEAAAIDGCSHFQTFVKIMLPLIKPATFSVGLLVFINCWNEYLYSLTFMSKDAMRTVPVGIALFPSNYQLPWGDMAAASIVCTLPLIALVLIFQKNIVAGLTTGGMKG